MNDPRCPRCGYDLTGAIRAWDRTQPPACPLEGRCTECGLEFLWRDVLSLEFSRQLRLIEHARSRILRSGVLTLGRCFRPRTFWTWVTMSHRTEPRRLVWFTVLGVFTSYMLCAGGLLLGLLLCAQIGPYWWYTPLSPTEAALPILAEHDSYLAQGQVVHPLALMAIGIWLFMPLTFLLLPQTLRSARVRRSHLARIWAYGLISLPAALTTAGLLRLLFDLSSWLGAYLGIPMGWSYGWEPVLDRRRWWSLPIVAMAWTSLWWASAAGSYLRLPRPRTIALTMVILSATLTLGVLVLGYPGGTWMMYHMDPP